VNLPDAHLCCTGEFFNAGNDTPWRAWSIQILAFGFSAFIPAVTRSLISYDSSSSIAPISVT
jgi:hypothetical protein